MIKQPLTNLDMEYRVSFGSRKISKIVFCIIIMVLMAGCEPTAQLQETNNNPVASTPVQTPNSQTTAQEGNDTSGSNAGSSGESITVTYRNQSSNIKLNLNPARDQFYLDLSGMAPTDADTVFVVDSTMIENRALDIQTLLQSYRKAQDLFYLGEYRDALDEINRTLEIQETADGYALKGTIFFMLENPTAARAIWYRAVQMNPDIPVPSIPELENLIDDIREEDN